MIVVKFFIVHLILKFKNKYHNIFLIILLHNYFDTPLELSIFENLFIFILFTNNNKRHLLNIFPNSFIEIYPLNVIFFNSRQTKQNDDILKEMIKYIFIFYVKIIITTPIT